MKRVTLIATLVVVVVGLVAVAATGAQAYPTFGTTCVQAGCHSTQPVDPSLDPTDTVIPTSSPDVTKPVVTCPSPHSFRGDARIRLSAEDGAGGWGMGYVYYSVDGRYTHLVRVPANYMSIDVTLPVIPAPATGSAAHTVSFWSQDNYGNVGSAVTETFTVNARTAMSMPIAANHTSVYVKRPVTISGTVFAPGMKVVLYVKKPGQSSYSAYRTLTASSARKWSYTYTPGIRGSYYFKVRFAGDSEWLASSSTYKRVTVK